MSLFRDTLTCGYLSRDLFTLHAMTHLTVPRETEQYSACCNNTISSVRRLKQSSRRLPPHPHAQQHDNENERAKAESKSAAGGGVSAGQGWLWGSSLAATRGARVLVM